MNKLRKRHFWRVYCALRRRHKWGVTNVTQKGSGVLTQVSYCVRCRHVDKASMKQRPFNRSARRRMRKKGALTVR